MNTGVSNVKKILTQFNFLLSSVEINSLNKNYEIKNRRTIYNSLISSQNPSQLSPIRQFNKGVDKDKDKYNLGPFIKNVSNKPINEINDMINFILDKKMVNEGTEHIYHFVNRLTDYDYESNSLLMRMKNLIKLLQNFDGFYEYFVTQEIKADEDSDYHKIFKALKWNLFVCIYNLYLENPVLGGQDSDKESITYMNHMVHNYFDFCNFVYGNDENNNKMYDCDITNNSKYDSKRSESGYIGKSRFST